MRFSSSPEKFSTISSLPLGSGCPILITGLSVLAGRNFRKSHTILDMTEA